MLLLCLLFLSIALHVLLVCFLLLTVFIHPAPIAASLFNKFSVSVIQLQISKRKDYGCSEVQFAPKFPQNGRLLAQKQPEICQSCAKVALHGKNCAVARKRKSCAPQHPNFLVGLSITMSRSADSVRDIDINLQSSF